MIIAIVLLLHLVLFYFLKRSKSDFFKQSNSVLSRKRNQLIAVLNDFEIPKEDFIRHLNAFDYFYKNKTDYDGATIVKDLQTIGGYDAPASCHDYAYLHNRFFSIKGLTNKIKYDWQYAKDMEMLGVGSTTAYTRAILLILSTPYYYLYLIFKK